MLQIEDSSINRDNTVGKVDLCLKNNNYIGALQHCEHYLGMLLLKIMTEKKCVTTNDISKLGISSQESKLETRLEPKLETKSDPKSEIKQDILIRVKLLCNWCSSEDLCKLW